ncbi:retrotransposon protein, putative, ty1-copia subclass, partial [Tanacetum coccineum]
MVPTKKVDKTPYELWYGKVPNLSYLKVWGCEAFVKRDTPDKLEQISVKCIFIGYPKETMEASRSLEDLEIIQEEDTNPSLDTSLNHEEDDQEINEPHIPFVANYKAALLDPESEKWLAAMNEEMQSMKDNFVWELVELPPNAKTVGHKWL